MTSSHALRGLSRMLERRAGWILDRLWREGIPVWAVGGILRDALMGRSFKDLDLLVRSSSGIFETLFPEGIWVGKVIPAFVLTSRGRGKAPSVQISVFEGAIEAELSRRDFSINAMALRLEKTGESAEMLIDPFGGQADLAEGILRRPCRARDPFSEDPVRVLRLVRFASTLGFVVAEETLELVWKNVQSLSRIAGERRRHELINLFSGIFFGRLPDGFPAAFLQEVLLRSAGLSTGSGLDETSFSLRVKDVARCSRFDPTFRMWRLFHGMEGSPGGILSGDLPFSRVEKRRIGRWNRLVRFFSDWPRNIPWTPRDRSLLLDPDHRETVRRLVGQRLPRDKRKAYQEWSLGVIEELCRPWEEVQAIFVKKRED